MSRVRMESEGIPYAALGAPGGMDFFARIAGRAAADWPLLLDRDRIPPPSDSPFLDREAAASLIARLNPDLAPPASSACYVIAGQQAGLLTGPLYTFLKAVTAIRLARDLSGARGSPVLPLFWIASEDHDVLEVNRVTVNGRRFVHPYEGPLARGEVPQVADIDIRAARGPLLEFLRAALPPTEFTGEILAQVAAADFSGYATAFRDLMRGLFERWELRLVDPISLRPLTAPVLARLVERAADWPARLAEGAAALERIGVVAPLDGARIFEIIEGRRVPLDLVPAEAGRLAARVRAHGERFSGSAALRPICQDAALPIAATVGGPSELAYLRQIEPLYALADVRPSARAPRISATFLAPGIARAAAQAGIRPGQILEASRAAAAPPPRGDEADDLDGLRRASDALLAEIDRRRPEPEPRWFRRGRESVVAGVERIESELRAERLAASGLDRRRREKIAAAVLPEGRLQERVVNVLQFLNLHGPAFVERAVESLDPWDDRHRVVTIRSTDEPATGAPTGKDDRDAG